mmetsp:Transcript_13858/g.33437  ORF Transcript_13858/g.33437 Transcript_13858/m.33437 type:complete len:451 (+) Transcript_13858:3162-4514(+)
MDGAKHMQRVRTLQLVVTRSNNDGDGGCAEREPDAGTERAARHWDTVDRDAGDEAGGRRGIDGDVLDPTGTHFGAVEPCLVAKLGRVGKTSVGQCVGRIQPVPEQRIQRSGDANLQRNQRGVHDRVRAQVVVAESLGFRRCHIPVVLHHLLLQRGQKPGGVARKGRWERSQWPDRRARVDLVPSLQVLQPLVRPRPVLQHLDTVCALRAPGGAVSINEQRWRGRNWWRGGGRLPLCMEGAQAIEEEIIPYSGLCLSAALKRHDRSHLHFCYRDGVCNVACHSDAVEETRRGMRRGRGWRRRCGGRFQYIQPVHGGVHHDKLQRRGRGWRWQRWRYCRRIEDVRVQPRGRRVRRRRWNRRPPIRVAVRATHRNIQPHILLGEQLYHGGHHGAPVAHFYSVDHNAVDVDIVCYRRHRHRRLPVRHEELVVETRGVEGRDQARARRWRHLQLA